MKSLLRLLAFFFAFLLSASALAAPPGGANELRVGQGGTLPGISFSGGYHMQESGASRGLTLFGANAAYGRFIADDVEIGSGFTLLVIDEGRNDTVFGPGIAPFVKHVTNPGGTGFYLEGTVLFQALIAKNSTGFFGGGIDLGIESFVRDAWSLRVGPSYRMLLSTEGSSHPLHAFGASWALSAYW
jgi:hypothetical protein